MKKIVLLRHGESIWNKENPFTRNFRWDIDCRSWEQPTRDHQIFKKHLRWRDRSSESPNSRSIRVRVRWWLKTREWLFPWRPGGNQETHGSRSQPRKEKVAGFMPLIRNYSLSLQPNKLKHYCGRERRTNFTRTYRRRRTSVRHRVQTILPGIVRLRLPICNSTRIGGDRTRRDDVAVGKPKIPSSGHVSEITPLHDCPQ